jgi:hypothetical protein
MSDAADVPLDEVDAAILAELADAYTAADPPPADLDARVSFAIALAHDDQEIEVALLTEDLLAGAGARSSDQARTLTFDCAALTIMITVAPLPGGGLRLDGWLAPPAALTVDVRAGGSATVTDTVRADDTGRFVVDEIAPGLAQVTVRLPAGRSVATPAILL